MDEKTKGGISIEKLVSLFVTLRAKKPRPEKTDYSRWDQTEEQYQQEQAQWLENIRRRKEKDNH